MIQLAWRFVRFHKDSALAHLVSKQDGGTQRRAQNENDRRPCPQADHRAVAHGDTGEVPHGVVLRQPA